MNLVENEILAANEPSSGQLEQLRTALNRYCLSLTESPWDAEDLAQDTWVKALSLFTRHGHRNPEALLLRIAKNTWIDQARRKNVLARILKEERAWAALPENSLTEIEIEMALHALLKHLPPLQRTVFLLRNVFEYSIAETARLLKTTEGAVKAALHRARKSLDSARAELESGTLPPPSEPYLKDYLRSIASAYRAGDIPAIVELAMRDIADPAAAIGILQTRLLGRQLASPSRARFRGSRSDMLRMAA
ncbi:RNA polymerase sigma factor [Cohnella mopanensis]|uniref:RNA polymerase sigma factor n=1 Tax=Cohnella mopanensis TaxID=2911966 RepID=UPI001EF96F28|nr:RNA polymerase sigma factor [Cohnella mopanensis]